MNDAHSDYLLAFDVGGTNIKWQALTLSLEPLEAGTSASETPDTTLPGIRNGLREAPSNSDKSAETIVAQFCAIITDSLRDYTLPRALCFAFPGPFDYAQGISYMKGLSKYESLYGLNFARLLREALTREAERRDMAIAAGGGTGWPALPFFFENDARCFALGEYRYFGRARNGGMLSQHRSSQAPRRLVCLTIGTGLGSSFIADGQIVCGQWGIPESGMLYDQQYEGHTIDDQFSRRGLITLAREAGFSAAEAPDVADIAQLATSGNARAHEVFVHFGRRFGSALDPWMRSFQPDMIVLGGKIAQALPLFLPGIVSAAPDWAPLLTVSSRGSESAIIGAGSLYTPLPC